MKDDSEEKFLARASRLHKRLLNMAKRDPVAFEIVMPSFISHYGNKEKFGMQQLLRDAITANREEQSEKSSD